MDQYTEPTTTADSKEDGRLKVATGCPHGKKKCLKCVISKSKNGKGGPGYPAPGYGASPKAPSYIKKPTLSMTSKPHKAMKTIGSLKMKRMKTLSSTIKSLNKKTSFGKALGVKKPKGFKGLLKSII
jgi:hypothetical protein